MDFNSIWLLAFLLVVPIIVHLFSFRRVKKFYFSNIQFIANSASTAKSRTRLKHLLVLATRLITFLLLLVIFYKIFFEKNSTSEFNLDRVYLDGTPSMYIERNSKRPIDEAQSLIARLGAQEKNVSSDPNDFWKSSSIISDFQGIRLDLLDRMVSDTNRRRSLYVAGNIATNFNAFIDSLHIDFNPDDFSKISVELFPSFSGTVSNENVVFRLLQSERQLSSVVQSTSDNEKIVFDVPLNLVGEFTIEIEGDQVLYDNEFRFVISDRKRPSILLIDPADNLYLQSVFANQELFTLQRTDLNNFDYDLLRDADVVIANEVAALPSSVISQLEGKTVIVFAPASKNEVLELDWMGLSLSPNEDDNRYDLEIDLDNPLLAGIYAKHSPESSLPTAQSQYVILGDYMTVASLRNKAPFLVKSQINSHYFFNAPIDQEFTDLPTHSIFLPLLYKIALISVGMGERTYYAPRDIGFLPSTNRKLPPRITSSEIEIIPDFNPVPNGISFLIPEVKPGFYELVNHQDTLEIAINHLKSESMMEGVTVQDLRERYKDFNHLSIQSPEEAGLLRSESEKNLWKYALILTVFMLLTETLFHKYLQ